MAEYRNVSVRLSNDDFEQLQYLREKYDNISYGKVSNADVIRTAIKRVYQLEKETEEVNTKE
ncbi:hypothetical protein [Bacillus amyloliquefaciens]|uniref:hypothetical protein n=1 Tax=Bacillus subtilis group TaxID=653685 RepID=UPI0005F05CE1|nr:hypothetical protein [Bacillus amyloliquefaciens]